jgi:hypothetical protein
MTEEHRMLLVTKDEMGLILEALDRFHSGEKQLDRRVEEYFGRIPTYSELSSADCKNCPYLPDIEQGEVRQ